MGSTVSSVVLDLPLGLRSAGGNLENSSEWLKTGCSIPREIAALLVRWKGVSSLGISSRNVLHHSLSPHSCPVYLEPSRGRRLQLGLPVDLFERWGVACKPRRTVCMYLEPSRGRRLQLELPVDLFQRWGAACKPHENTVHNFLALGLVE